MDKFAEKFNTFDIFTMLIPGICISSLFCISLSFNYYSLWIKMGNEKYLIFIIFSYFCGIIYQELGTMFDKKFLYKILYKGNPREIFLLENGHDTILNEELFFRSALKIKEYIITNLHIQINSNMTENEEKDLNSLIFGYCLNLSEINNLTGKSEKMIMLSEMSRSLFWGCISTIILNIFMIIICPSFCIFYCVEIFFLFIASYIFIQRKKRYEKYRIRILLRTLLLHIYKPTQLPTV